MERNLNRKKIKFLMDTGCGHDLISQKKIEKHDLETLAPEPISFQTANGVTDTDLVSNFPVRILQGTDQSLRSR